MTLINRIKRSIKRLVNSDYKLIDTSNRVFDGKEYTPEKDKFFRIARNFQDEHGLTQKEAVKIIHDSFRVVEATKEGKTTKTDVQQIYDDWYDYDFDLDLGVDYIVDEY